MRIAVSCLAPDLATLAGLARAQAPRADLIELRLDHIDARACAGLAGLIRELRVPVIAACNAEDSFGGFRGDREERAARLVAAALAGASWIDVDARWGEDLESLPTPRVLSRHFGQAVPADLARQLRELEARARPQDLVKCVARVERAEDGLRLLATYDGSRAAERRIVFAAGEAGGFTRVLSPLLGAPWSYAAPRRGTETAPGQLTPDELRRAWPRERSDRTQIFAVIGRPIGHSLSPSVHNALFRARGFDGCFVACAPGELDAFLAGCSDRWRGLAITAPFKRAALDLADETSPDARRIGAANTLVRTARGWRADNTDLAGARHGLESAWNARERGVLAGRRLLVLGAGGAARAVLFAAQDLGLVSCVAARRFESARDLARSFGASAIAWTDIEGCEHDLLVHATPCGSLHGHAGELGLSRAAIRPGSVVIDAVYNPAETELLRLARERGAHAGGGANWFVRQAALQSALFTGLPADEGLIQSVLDAELAL